MVDQSLNWKQKFWSTLVIALAFWTGMETPWSFAFPHSQSKIFTYIDLFTAFIFLADVVMFVTRTNTVKQRKLFYRGRKNNPWILSSNVYLAAGIISSIPFDFFIESLNLDTRLEIIDLVRLFKILRTFKLLTLPHMTNYWNRVGKLVFTFMWVLLGIHWITCIWISLNPIGTEGHFTVYNKAFYWAVTSLTTVGYGDITPQTNTARIFTVMIMLLGVGLYGVIIGYVSQILINADKFNRAYREKMEDLSMFMRHYSIPGQLQEQVFSFYEHLLGKRLTNNDHKIISELPLALQNDLKVYMRLRMVREISIFNKLDADCLKTISERLQQHIFAPGDLIIKRGEIGDELFLIGHGEVEILDKDNRIVAILGEGKFIGERALLAKTRRNADVRAREYCDMYILKKNDFYEVMHDYPRVLKEMEKEIRARRGS